MAKQRRQNKPGGFPSSEQAALAKLLAAPAIEQMDIGTGTVHSALWEAAQHRYGVRLVAVVVGVAAGLTHVLDPECERIDDRVLPGYEPMNETNEDSWVNVSYYVRPIPMDSSEWNAIPQCDTRRRFVQLLREHVSRVNIEDIE